MPGTQALSPTEMATAGPVRRSLVEAHPERIGAYRIVRVLGKGGMGIVYLAEQEKPVRRHVALKLIQPEMDSRDLLARFEAERQALAMLDHPNIARIFEAGMSEGGWPYFVMEYVEGLPLLEYCERRALGTRARLELFIPVCEALHHAHRRGILHRDVKPSNILIGEVDGRPAPKLIDFGLAKAPELKLTDKTLSTRLGQILGTPAYMSPEQISPGADVAPTPRTDVYALGVSLYQLLTGLLPFDMESLAARGYGELQRVIRESDPPKPSSRVLEGSSSRNEPEGRKPQPAAVARDLRGDLDWITMKAMEKEPARRYASAAALAEDLRRHLDREPVLARPPSRTYRLARLVRRKPMHAVLAAVLLVLLPLGGWLLYRNLEQHRRLTDATVQDMVVQLGRAGTDPAKLLELSDRILALRPDDVQALRARAAGYFNRAL
ncbi:MAG TPA: serine/threonine-protein kinase, partial [Candidatus Polarisedimenticolia bacterium]|nr:serine/threonine-protein kinase [Candidatus Polarisedimenticolia bacterium]